MRRETEVYGEREDDGEDDVSGDECNIEEGNDEVEEIASLNEPLEPMSISSSSITSSIFDPTLVSYFDTSTLIQDSKYVLSVVLDKFGPYYPLAIAVLLMLGAVSVTKAINGVNSVIRPNTLPSSSTLLYHLTAQSILARQRGQLFTSFIISSQYASSGAPQVPDFVISIADTSMKQQEASFAPQTSIPIISTSPSAESTPKNDALSLNSISLDLLVDSSISTHTLVLNKYNTFKLHALLVTNSFELQSSGLNLQDIKVVMMYIQAITAVGFFNSAEISGASQPHKHIQLVPLDSFREVMDMAHHNSTSTSSLSTLFPIDTYIKKSNINMSIGQIVSLKDLPFQHFVTLLPTTASTPEDLFRAYESMRRMCAGREYNFILTTEWMMMVPRSKAEISLSSSMVPVNSFGFMGFLLAANQDQLKEILSHQAGVLDLLKQVTFEK